jgi:hypothetical protein
LAEHSFHSKLRPGAGGTATIIAATTIMGGGTTVGIITAIGIADAASEEGKREGDITVTEMELAKNFMNYSSSDC